MEGLGEVKPTTMKNILLLATTLFSIFTFAQGDPIINFPDANFKAKLLAAGPFYPNNFASTQTPDINGLVTTYHKIDTNNDGQIQLSEALLIKYLIIEHTNFQTLEGISNFTNLHVLWCNNSSLTSLNLEGLNNLRFLRCQYNYFTNLNVQGLTNLKYLDCSNNQLQSLNLQGLANLQTLLCINNQISSLNLEGINNLQSINCRDNLLTSLNVSNNTALIELWCSNNLLTSLFIKNVVNFTLYNLGFNNNPNLNYVCCSDNQLTQIQQKVIGYGYTNCQVNTYCSFTPGGNYNTISGQIKYDFNQNGCDANDEPLINRNILFSQGTNNGIVTTNNQGNYSAYVGQGTHTITPQIENPSLFISTPPTANINFPNSNNNTQTQNFCITPNPANITCSYESVIMPISPVRPGFDTDFKIIYRNLGNVVLTGEVVLPYNANTMTYISATPAPTTISNGLLKWSFNQMMPLQNRQITLKFNINPPTQIVVWCINPFLMKLVLK